MIIFIAIYENSFHFISTQNKEIFPMKIHFASLQVFVSSNMQTTFMDIMKKRQKWGKENCKIAVIKQKFFVVEWDPLETRQRAIERVNFFVFRCDDIFINSRSIKFTIKFAEQCERDKNEWRNVTVMKRFPSCNWEICLHITARHSH